MGCDKENCDWRLPTAKGLFQKAISTSGAYAEFQYYWDYIASLATGETIGTSAVPSGQAIASSVNCGSQTACPY